MSVARKRYTPDEKAQIVSLHEEGYTYRDIAERIRPGVDSAWRSIGEIVREHKKAQETQPQAPTSANDVLDVPADAPKLVQVPTAVKGKSPITLPESIRDSVTAREIMAMFDDEQREVFVATYEDLRGEADEDSLTRAENEMLMRAAFAHTQYLRAARMYSQCESYLMMDLNGEIVDNSDPRKRMAGRGDSYKKEMETRHKEYMELIDGLKLKRSQRLDRIKDTRNTFLDLQQELMTKARQSSIIEDIKKINLATREELERMSKGEVGPDGVQVQWLIGAFEDFLGEEDGKRENQAVASSPTEPVEGGATPGDELPSGQDGQPDQAADPGMGGSEPSQSTDPV